jgi:arsenate reductase (thioredoxin)
MEKARVLFLCTHNTARSQMAEAFLKKFAGDRFEVFSAGYHLREIHPYTKQVMAEIGIAISDQNAKNVKEFLGHKDFRYLIVVCEQAEKTCPKVFPGVLIRMFWPFEDPVTFGGSDEEKLAKFREVRDKIAERIRLWLRELG